MERRRVIAWAGSITAIGCAGALALGALFGGFGLDPESEGGQVAGPAPVPGATEPELVPETPGPLPEPGAPATGIDPSVPTGSGPKLLETASTTSSERTGEEPSRQPKIGYLPEPTTRLSPQREPPTAASAADTSKQGDDPRIPGYGHRETVTKPSAVNTSKPDGNTHGADRGQSESARASSAANSSGLSLRQSKASTRDQPSARRAKKSKGDHAAGTKGGRGD